MFIAIKTTDVGVATFSLILNSKLRTENEHISTPLPAKALKFPPTKPIIMIYRITRKKYHLVLNTYFTKSYKFQVYEPVRIRIIASHQEQF